MTAVTAERPFSNPVAHKAPRVELPLSVRKPFVVPDMLAPGGIWLDDEPEIDDN